MATDLNRSLIRRDDSSWSRVLLIGFAVSVLILLLTALLSTWNHYQLVKTARNELESYSFLRHLADVEAKLITAQNAERGFIITGETDFLEPFEGATNELASLFDKLRDYAAHHSEQQRRLQDLNPMVAQVLDLLRQYIDIRAKGFEAAKQKVETQQVKQLTDEIGRLITEMVGEENTRLLERQGASARAQRLAFWFNNSGRLLSILLFAGVFFVLLKENSLRRRSEQALKEARDQLEKRVEDRTLELNEKNKELETVVYIISHDLRSPLVNVQGFSRRLERACARLKEQFDSAPPGAAPDSGSREVMERIIPQALSFIETAVKRMDQLLTGFLRYSRLGRIALNPRPLDMNRLIQGVVQSMRYQMEQSGAEIQVDSLPPCHGDPTQTEQVFANLIDNALKYRDPARPLRVAITGRTKNGQSIYTVSDTGIGIAPEHLAKVFEIFHRLNPDGVPGEGLGLTIAQRILERQRGKIWVESQPGQGSRFSIALPNAASSA